MYVGRTGRRNVSHCQQQSFSGLRSPGGSCTTYSPGQKSLGQYGNIHIFLSFLGPLLKQCILFEILLQFSLPPSYTMLNLGKTLNARVQHCLWGEGRGWTCVNWKTPQKRKCVPRLLSMIVWKRWKEKKAVLRVFQACKSVFSGFRWKIVIEQTFFQLFRVFWTCFKNSLETNDIHQKL